MDLPQGRGHEPPAGAADGSQPRPPPTSLETMDQDELLAVRALEDLMHASTAGSPAPSSAGGGEGGRPGRRSASTSSSVASAGAIPGPGTAVQLPTGGAIPPISSASDPNFVSRVSSLPVVNPLLRAYSTATGGSRVVRYVEGTIGAVGGSLIGEERRAVWDEWGCRTLDRVGLGTPTDEAGDLAATPPGSGAAALPSSRGRPEVRRPSNGRADAVGGIEGHPARAYTGETARDFAHETERAFLAPSTAQSTAASSRSGSASPPSTRRSSLDRYGRLPVGAGSTSLLPTTSAAAHRPSPSAGGGSRWSNMLVEAGMTAGGIGAAVSEESMKSLKYCLQWLQYATAHIDHQIHLLRDFLQTLSSPTTPQNALISPSALHTLSRIKADVVETIRKVVGVVSTYAGGALPEAARRRVKDLVLALPERWAMANPAGGEEGDREEGPTIVAAKAATGRVLSLAVEGLDMLSGCAGIFGESLERAEMWVERLRILGLQRAAAHQHRDQASSAQPQLISAGPLEAREGVPLAAFAMPPPTAFGASRSSTTTTTTTDTTGSGASTPTLESSFSHLQQSISSDATTEPSVSTYGGADGASGRAEPMDAEDEGRGMSSARVRKWESQAAGADIDGDNIELPAVGGTAGERGKKSRVASIDATVDRPAGPGAIQEMEMRESP